MNFPLHLATLAKILKKKFWIFKCLLYRGYESLDSLKKIIKGITSEDEHLYLWLLVRK